LRGVIKDAIFDALDHHAVCSLDLAIATWVGHRGVVDVDEAVLAEVPEVRPYKSLPQVSDDPVGYPEPMGYVFYEAAWLLHSPPCISYMS
jgi:hypothetical protein